MPKFVTTGATLQCSFGAAPSPFTASPMSPATAGNMAVGTIQDKVPLLNIKPFGPCSSPAYPPTASATAAALGVLTPMPCFPNVPGPWFPGSMVVKVNNQPALLDNCKAVCAFGGQISVIAPSQFVAEAKS